ncbi:MAG: 6-bladed beta-propeller [Desulforhabdus sp.]|jgi:DNA-binding beta-propeller fold protein YncE|nr:6-bladed beta-propeller [Desulforhabdus sp.]
MTILTKGAGDTHYRSNRNFLKLPEGKHFGMVRAVAVDSRQRVFVGHRDLVYHDLPPVAVFDQDGKFLGGWGEGFFKGLHQVVITPDDIVFVVDNDRHQIYKFTTEGELLMTIGDGFPRLNAPFNFPADVAVSVNGDIYVADGDANTCIHKFSKNGEHLLSWGTAGKGRGQLTTPHSITVDRQERVYVGDRDTGRILVFDKTGKYITEWTDVLWRPTSVFIDLEQVLIVSDLNCHIHMYDLQGNVLGRGHCAGPMHSICGDDKGNLYIVMVEGFPYIEKWERVVT